MTPPTFTIGVSLAHTLPIGLRLGTDLFPTVSAVVRELTEGAHRQWVDYAMGAPLPGGGRVSNRTGAYARSIMLRQVNDLTGEVFTDLPYARAIEFGTKARDLHDILHSSLKVRLTKKGKRYLIIPFRHDHPNSVVGNPMPAAVHGWWTEAARTSTHITGTYRRLSGTGAFDIKTRAPLTVPGWHYKWGTRLTKPELARMGLDEKAQRRFANMYRFDKPRKDGNGHTGTHQQFITFRSLVQGSPGWRVPARPGLHVAKAVADKIRPIAEAALPRAMEADVRRILNGA